MSNPFIRRRSLLQRASLLPLCALPASWASTAPGRLRGLQLVVPTPAGTQPDVIARWVAEPLAYKAGVPVLVVNVPGASGALAVDTVLRASPDSGALLLGGLDHVAYSHLNSDRRAMDPFVDFTPVAAVNRDSWVIVTSSDAPAVSLQALVVQSQRAPLNYASTGEGSTAHLLAARLSEALGLKNAQHVPYSTPWIPDMLAGRIQFAVVPVPSVAPHLRSGRMIALASLTGERLALPGNPPSIRELGLPDQIFHGGLFLFAPAALSPLAPQLNAWFRDVVGHADMRRRYQDVSIEPVLSDLRETGALVRERLERVDTMRLAVFGRTR
jgi:tripartite-type tricarboxylate transporter receptor subunit TctC